VKQRVLMKKKRWKKININVWGGLERRKAEQDRLLLFNSTIFLLITFDFTNKSIIFKADINSS